ncbi:hypothetical protein HOLleu_17023 [Holothuria leucospilota]|uniref:Uncharacterized protein n=1 Tax=Holothuria leucospilota TaxID=206669 RepID=A0A9Q1H882_HOLLE|nr:hypothetical protein HOLleu_17023 [Holothuria leucospilota]
MTMTMLTFVAFLVGIFSTCYSAPSTPPVKESTFTFALNGISHTETIKVEGSLVTLTDAIDGFLVVLDYERNIFMLKNLTSQTCSFSRLENIPVTRDSELPIFVQEVTETSLQENGGQEADVVLLEKVGEIPAGYVRLTNDLIVAEKCFSQPSYWLKIKDISRQRRGDCDWDWNWDWDCVAHIVREAAKHTYTTYIPVNVVTNPFSWLG